MYNIVYMFYGNDVSWRVFNHFCFFLSFFLPIGVTSKNHDLLATHQNVKKQTTCPLWHHFHSFYECSKVKTSFVKKKNCMVLVPPKNIDFPLIVSSMFHACSKPLPGTVLDGPSAELLSKVGFGCRFQFSCFSKRHHLDYNFYKK